jgi:hypothetical protein
MRFSHRRKARAATPSDGIEIRSQHGPKKCAQAPDYAPAVLFDLVWNSKVYGQGRAKSARVTNSIVDEPETAEEVDFIGGVERVGDIPYPQIHAGVAACSLPTEACIQQTITAPSRSR